MKTQFALGTAMIVLVVAITGATGSAEQYATKPVAGVPTFSKDVAPILTGTVQPATALARSLPWRC
ncbi:MAG: hypothetical protein H0W08_09540 [Acidobacteria bacterium]|nr:hypothetical protein [Acidobacteriota bacterium]